MIEAKSPLFCSSTVRLRLAPRPRWRFRRFIPAPGLPGAGMVWLASLGPLTLRVRKRVSAALLNNKLAGVSRDDLGRASKGLNDSRRACALAHQRCFRRSKFRSVASPNDHGEYLAWIGQVEVEECRLSFCPCRVPRRRHDTTDGRVLADVKGSLIWREHIVRNGGRRDMNSNARDKCRNGNS